MGIGDIHMRDVHIRWPRGTARSRGALCGDIPTNMDLLWGWIPVGWNGCKECVQIFEDQHAQQRHRAKRGDRHSISVQAVKKWKEGR